MRILDPAERDGLHGQRSLFALSEETPAPVDSAPSQVRLDTPEASPEEVPVAAQSEPEPVLFEENESLTGGFTLNAEQQAVVNHQGGPLLISAGPGTGLFSRSSRGTRCKISNSEP